MRLNFLKNVILHYWSCTPFADGRNPQDTGNNISTEEMIAYLRQHPDTNLHQDYLNHLTSTNSKFVLKNIPLTSIRTELSGLDQEKVEQYKKMDFTKAPPIVVGSDGNILDGYHRANVAKALGIPTIKAYVGTAEEWDEWTTAAQMKHNFRYWLAEEALGHIQDFVTWPTRKLYDIKYYINNRWVSRTHSLTAHARDIKPGQWQDVGNRFLPCLFNELVDFVEKESAWSHIAWGSKEDRAKYNPPFWASGWFRWRTWRSPQAGLDHLDWAMTLTMGSYRGVDETDPNHGKPTGQAEHAREIKELYIWWTTVYPNRPDPHDASGWSAYCEAARVANGGKWSWSGDKTPELKKMCDKSHKLLQKIEAAYDKEDTEMMIRLIKIRGSLWT